MNNNDNSNNDINNKCNDGNNGNSNDRNIIRYKDEKIMRVKVLITK